LVFLDFLYFCLVVFFFFYYYKRIQLEMVAGSGKLLPGIRAAAVEF